VKERLSNSCQGLGAKWFWARDSMPRCQTGKGAVRLLGFRRFGPSATFGACYGSQFGPQTWNISRRL